MKTKTKAKCVKLKLRKEQKMNVMHWQSLSSLPDTLVSRVSGLGHPGGVEHQVDVVVLVEDPWVR